MRGRIRGQGGAGLRGGGGREGWRVAGTKRSRSGVEGCENERREGGGEGGGGC